MLRLMLNDELWSKLREIMLQHRIYDKANLRMMVEAMLCWLSLATPTSRFWMLEFNLPTI